MQEANRLIAADCEKDETLEFVDVWPAMLGEDGQPRKDIFRDDGLHMNDAGYELWVELLRPIVRPAEPRSPSNARFTPSRCLVATCAFA